LLLEAREAPASPPDRRPLALSHGSRLILERLGVGRVFENATAITRIHISHRGRFGRAVFTAAEVGLPALGYVLDYGNLAAALATALTEADGRRSLRILRGARVVSIAHEASTAHVTFDAASGGECFASVVAVADGSAEAAGVPVRVIQYRQSAVSARVKTDLPHGENAYERFTPEGPLALLPSLGGYAIVWVSSPERAEELCNAAPQQFLRELQKAFGERAGHFVDVQERTLHPVALRMAEHVTTGRAALIGNAAQALHPVAGQGLNLGLRDAWELACEIRKRGAQDPGVLQAYAARRRIDRYGSVGFTHTLVRIFSTDSLPLRITRGIGLTLLDVIPPAKHFVIHRMIFGARG
jgi:2-octaprenyl-6-methoxyphenol hydroxylase